MPINHLTAGARDREALVHDDRDRCELLRRVRRALRGAILAYCVMDTHLHVVAGSPAEALEHALLGYVRWFNRRHGRRGALLRGPVAAIEKRDRTEIVRAIRYVHANPLKTQPPLVERAFEFPWSGERELVGLSCAGLVDVRRVRALAGFLPALSPGPALADANPRRAPTAAPGVLVAAAAQAFALHPDDLAGPGRVGPAAEARELAVALCVGEGFGHARIGPFLGRSRQQIGRLAARTASESAIRISRTLAGDERLRAWLAPAGVVEQALDERGALI